VCSLPCVRCRRWCGGQQRHHAARRQASVPARRSAGLV